MAPPGLPDDLRPRGSRLPCALARRPRLPQAALHVRAGSLPVPLGACPTRGRADPRGARTLLPRLAAVPVYVRWGDAGAPPVRVARPVATGERLWVPVRG